MGVVLLHQHYDRFNPTRLSTAHTHTPTDQEVVLTLPTGRLERSQAGDVKTSASSTKYQTGDGTRAC